MTTQVTEKSWLLRGDLKPSKTKGSSTPILTDILALPPPDDDPLTCSGHHGRAKSGLGVLLTSFFLVAQVAGVGVLALPWAVAQTGWAGIGLIALACLVVGFSACHLAYCWIILEERWPEYQRACRKPYPAMAFRTLGMKGWHFVNVIQSITLFGVSAVTILLSAELVQAVLASLLPKLTVCTCIVACGCVLIPLSWLGSPKEFWQGSVLAILASTAAIVVVIVKITIDAPGESPTYTPPTISSFFLGFGTILFSFGGAVTFPTIQNDMSDRSKFPLSVIIAFVVLLTMYIPMSTLGYLEFGDAVEVNILLSVHGPAVNVTRVLMLVNNAFTYILIANPLSQSLEEAFNLPNSFGWRRCIIRTSIVAGGVLVSLAVQNFGKILNLIGSFCVPVLTFILPPVFYIKLCDAEEQCGWIPRDLSLWRRLCLWGVVLIGAVGGIASSYSALEALFTPGEISDTCFSWS